MDNPLISIIIPSYGDADFVRKNLSILGGIDAWEIIVVEAGNTTYELSNCVFIKSSKANRAFQMNLGAEYARGDLLIFLHADTFVPPSSILHLYSFLSLHPSYVGGTYRFSLDSNSWKAHVIEMGVYLREKIFGLSYGDQCIFVWKRVFRSVGGFPEEPVFEDALFLKKLRSEGMLYNYPEKCVTSARKWEKRGYLKTVIEHNALALKWALKLSSDKTKRIT
ncbi:MAG: glycosyltransferase [Candidatus Dadabacteria bacterium]|nr:MAG: glycosyltransferase [Candidatus Dadabacteria bacterium]